MSFQIPRCYDSHCHFLATGQIKQGLKLFDLAVPDDVSKLKIEPKHFQGDWLVGFGWDQHKWSGKFHNQFPTKEILDAYFPDFPVVFSRADGHAYWVNSKALEKSGANKNSNGVFWDDEKAVIDKALPPHTVESKKSFFKTAMEYFNHQGFTHIRDMSCTLEQWNLLREMDQKGELTLYVEENFICDTKNNFEKTLIEAETAKATPSAHLRALGIKIFYDGALGSEGALLSEPYCHSHEHGFSLWDLPDLTEIMKKTWDRGFELSVHTIGDEAAHQIAKLALELKQKGIKGRLNFEHAQMLRPETVQIISELDAVCHMQPCHWLSDRHWLKEKLGDLYKYAFPWRPLEVAGIKFQFGSDAPVEEASVRNNMLALEESAAEGIAPLSGDIFPHFSHPDPGWGGECRSEFT